MIAALGTYGLSITAGVLSTLSPCVLPIVPILVGTALTTHRFGPYALASGLALSFTIVGVFLASLGAAIGIDQEIFKNFAAVLLMLFGVVLVFPGLQERLAVASSGLSEAGQVLLGKISTDSLWGQFLLGMLLGLVWSPCVGPTLGATITLASQGKDIAHVIFVMALFGLGAGIPMILLGLVSRQAIMNMRNKLFLAGTVGKKLLGGFLLLLGLLIVSGGDKLMEKWLLQNSPDWLVQLTTSI